MNGSTKVLKNEEEEDVKEQVSGDEEEEVTKKTKNDEDNDEDNENNTKENGNKSDKSDKSDNDDEEEEEKKEDKKKGGAKKPQPKKSARQIAARMKKMKKTKKTTPATTTSSISTNKTTAKNTKKKNQEEEEENDKNDEGDEKNDEEEKENEKSKQKSKEPQKDSSIKTKSTTSTTKTTPNTTTKTTPNTAADSAKKTNKKKKEEEKEDVSKVSREERFKRDSGLNSYRICTGTLMSRPTSRDVKIGAFSLQSYGKELIKDTDIELTIGRRYGLIGSNGCGKSTFLKCLAHREVPIPSHIDIFFLEEEVEPSSRTALQSITDSVEEEVQKLETQLEQVIDNEGPDSVLVQELNERLEELNPEIAEVKAAKLLHGLGFDKKSQKKQTKDLSGGWRMRVALAKALFVKPTLLLLDEPTNHLDLEACVWLENYLKSYDRCLVVVSHSQDFLNGVCTNIIHITPKKKLQVYSGNYDTFVKTKTELEINQMKKYKKEQDDIKHIKNFIASCGTYSNLVRQGKSKQKIIDKMEAAGLTERVESEHNYKFYFPPCGILTPPVLAFYNVSFSYSGESKDFLYQNLNLGVDLDSRIALVGKNGTGKSTLLKLMVDELQPTQGSIRKHTDLRIARYHQHSNDLLDPSQTALQFMKTQFKKAMPEVDEEGWRALLGKYGVSGQNQTVKMNTLSDGQKSRIVFAYLATKNPHLLLLDEPTNHLDMDCIDALAKAINAFEGGMVLVSHDFRLINQVAKEIWVVGDKKITKWKGDISSYKKSLVKELQGIL